MELVGIRWKETERKGRDAHINIISNAREGNALSRGLLFVDYYCRRSTGAAASSNVSCTAVKIIGRNDGKW
jgi:hypothetical protein